MTTGAPPVFSWRDLVPIVCSVVGAAFVVGGALRFDGGRDRLIEENTRRIAQLEANDRVKQDLLTAIDGRTIRIETKLEIIGSTKETAQ